MNAARVRRGSGGRGRPRKAASRVKVPKKIVSRLPVEQESANRLARWTFGLFALAIAGVAAASHRLLGCKGISRSDFRWDDELGEAGVYLLEVNTQPGMTPLSLAPEQAKQRGIEYGELVERLIAEALGEDFQPLQAEEATAR